MAHAKPRRKGAQQAAPLQRPEQIRLLAPFLINDRKALRFEISDRHFLHADLPGRGACVTSSAGLRGLAGMLGLEPRYRVPETRVLPIGRHPIISISPDTARLPGAKRPAEPLSPPAEPACRQAGNKKGRRRDLQILYWRKRISSTGGGRTAQPTRDSHRDGLGQIIGHLP